MEFVVSKSSFRKFLTSPELLPELQKRVDRIAAAAGEGYVGRVNPGRKRHRGAVITTTGDAIRDNARNNTLVRALDAGKG